MGDVRRGTGKDERTCVSERTEAAMRLHKQTGSAVRARPAGNRAGEVADRCPDTRRAGRENQKT